MKVLSACGSGVPPEIISKSTFIGETLEPLSYESTFAA
jgi:hypothetical protein